MRLVFFLFVSTIFQAHAELSLGLLKAGTRADAIKQIEMARTAQGDIEEKLLANAEDFRRYQPEVQLAVLSYFSPVIAKERIASLLPFSTAETHAKLVANAEIWHLIRRARESRSVEGINRGKEVFTRWNLFTATLLSGTLIATGFGLMIDSRDLGPNSIQTQWGLYTMISGFVPQLAMMAYIIGGDPVSKHLRLKRKKYMDETKSELRAALERHSEDGLVDEPLKQAALRTLSGRGQGSGTRGLGPAHRLNKKLQKAHSLPVARTLMEGYFDKVDAYSRGSRVRAVEGFLEEFPKSPERLGEAATIALLENARPEAIQEMRESLEDKSRDRILANAQALSEVKRMRARNHSHLFWAGLTGYAVSMLYMLDSQTLLLAPKAINWLVNATPLLDGVDDTIKFLLLSKVRLASIAAATWGTKRFLGRKNHSRVTKEVAQIQQVLSVKGESLRADVKREISTATSLCPFPNLNPFRRFSSGRPAAPQALQAAGS